MSNENSGSLGAVERRFIAEAAQARVNRAFTGASEGDFVGNYPGTIFRNAFIKAVMTEADALLPDRNDSCDYGKAVHDAVRKVLTGASKDGFLAELIRENMADVIHEIVGTAHPPTPTTVHTTSDPNMDNWRSSWSLTARCQWNHFSRHDRVPESLTSERLVRGFLTAAGKSWTAKRLDSGFAARDRHSLWQFDNVDRATLQQISNNGGTLILQETVDNGVVRVEFQA